MAVYPSKDVGFSPKDYPARAVISDVIPGSPAYDAGFEAGCIITSLNGKPLTDIIDWRWRSEADAIPAEVGEDDGTGGEVITVGYIDLDGDRGEVELWREDDEPWGFEFDQLIFNGVRRCRNACTFCFMRQLPKGMRDSLYVRDDDFRLSFLAGTFVTLTNLSQADEKRILEQRISPLRVSLQAVEPEVRERLIGKHAPHGLDALERLLEAGIQCHAQVVLVPGENDGAHLRATLEWAYARPGILTVGIVPLGYTRHQSIFDRSFNEPGQASAVLADIAGFQQRALSERGNAWVYAADEFYLNAYGDSVLDHLPDAGFYDGFDMFEDGIGIVRSVADDWRQALDSGLMGRTAAALQQAGEVAYLVAGEAQRPFIDPLIAEAGERVPAIRDVFVPVYAANTFFGGNVDVTGLLTARDICLALDSITEDGGNVSTPVFGDRRGICLVPRVVFNDDGVTLDDATLEDMEDRTGRRLHVVSCSPSEYLDEILQILNR